MARLTCPKNHPLVPEVKADVTSTIITCDVCNKSEELVFQSCRICNYDVCEFCMWKHFVKCGLATRHTYNPQQSNVRQAALFAFLEQDTVDISKCPGIGPAFVTKLQHHGIENLYQLMGFFARYRAVGVTQEQWTQAFFTWLIFQGAQPAWSHTMTTVMADKLSLLFDPTVCTVFDIDSFTRCDATKLLPLPRRKRVDSPARSAVFDLSKSKMTNLKITNFIEKGDSLALGPLAKVSKPALSSSVGFGPKTCQALAKYGGVTNLFQLAGVFLQNCSTGMTQVQFLHAFYRWLIEHGAAAGYAATITDAVRQWAEVKFTRLYMAARAGGKKKNKPAASSAAVHSSSSTKTTATTSTSSASAGASTASAPACATTASFGVGGASPTTASFGVGGAGASATTASAGAVPQTNTNASSLDSMAALASALPSAAPPVSTLSNDNSDDDDPAFSESILPPSPPTSDEEEDTGPEDQSSCVVS